MPRSIRMQIAHNYVLVSHVCQIRTCKETKGKKRSKQGIENSTHCNSNCSSPCKLPSLRPGSEVRATLCEILYFAMHKLSHTNSQYIISDMEISSYKI